MPNNPTGIFNNEYPYTDFHELNLSWVIKKMKELLDRMATMESWRAQHEKQYQQLKDLYDAIMSGNFPPSIVAAFHKWMEENALDLVGELVKMVFFGLTDDGYFVAYIPESWNDIIFGTTGLDDIIPGVEYGRLTLSLNIGG